VGGVCAKVPHFCHNGEVLNRKRPKWRNRTSYLESDSSPISYSSFKVIIGLSSLVLEIFVYDTQTDR